MTSYDQSPGNRIQRALTLHGVHGEQRYLVPAAVRYDADRPLSVDLVLRPGAGRDEIVWEFARDLLAAGLTHATGQEGDVALDPGTVSGVVVVSLGVGQSRTVFHADRDQLAAFLAETWGIVPSGAEVSTGDIDAALEQILGR